MTEELYVQLFAPKFEQFDKLFVSGLKWILFVEKLKRVGIAMTDWILKGRIR